MIVCIAAGNTGFGNPASFGAQPASTGLFGATANQTPAAGGMFGGGTTTVFGQTQQQQPQQPAATFCEFCCNWQLYWHKVEIGQSMSLYSCMLDIR